MDAKLQSYLDAAQKCLAQAKAAPLAEEKLILRTKANQYLDAAEKLKKSPKPATPTRSTSSSQAYNLTSLATSLPSNTSGRKPRAEPECNRKLPTSEQKILWLSSKVNGHTFPPWTRTPTLADFAPAEDGSLFREASDLSLSPHQLKNFEKWGRPAEALPPPAWFRDRMGMSPSMVPSRPIDLVQDAALDCSVVASLCTERARVAKGFPSILADVMYPFDVTNNAPKLSPNGRYLVRLNFNGTRRAVEIDDRLPVSSSKRILHIIDRSNPHLLWPALLEKAYLKVRGGYDFPGSNSNVDLWVIAGWIPEIVFLQDASADELWRRVFPAFEDGDVLITVGTGKMSREAERELGLAGQHNYAILDLRIENGREMVLVKNPWCEDELWSDGSSTPEASIQDARQRQRERPLSRIPPHGNLLAPGTFWMALSDVFQNFEALYLNWNPALFSFRQDIHFQWDLSSAPRASSSLARNPQFSLSSEHGGTVWILLSRHFTTDPKVSAPSEATSDTTLPPTDDQPTGHMSLYVFANSGQRIYDKLHAVSHSPYVDAMQSLTRLTMPAHTTYTLAVSEQNLPPRPYFFSLKAYSSHAATLSAVAERYTHSVSRAAAWTPWTCGGSTTSPAFGINPQFRLTVAAPTRLALLLETSASDVSVNVKLCYGGGRRLFALRRQDTVLDTFEYRAGSSFVETRGGMVVEPGRYTVVASTYEPGTQAAFSLRVDSDQAVEVSEIPSEIAGRRVVRLQGAVFPHGANILALPLTFLRISTITFIVRSPPIRGAAHHRPSSPLLFRLQVARGPAARTLASSNGGEYSDATEVGLRIFDFKVQAELVGRGGLWLVVERLGSGQEGVEERYDVELLVGGVDGEAVREGRWELWEE